MKMVVRLLSLMVVSMHRPGTRETCVHLACAENEAFLRKFMHPAPPWVRGVLPAISCAFGLDGLKLDSASFEEELLQLLSAAD